jgi:hypothetical protein
MRAGVITPEAKCGFGLLGIDMGNNVIKLKGTDSAQGLDAVSDVVKWLREYADKIEKGEIRPTHKAVLILYEGLNEQFRVSTVCCNATTIERAGMISLSLHDTADLD